MDGGTGPADRAAKSTRNILSSVWIQCLTSMESGLHRGKLYLLNHIEHQVKRFGGFDILEESPFWTAPVQIKFSYEDSAQWLVLRMRKMGDLCII